MRTRNKYQEMSQIMIERKERNLIMRGTLMSLIFNSNKYIQMRLFTVMIISRFKKYIFSSI